MTLGLRLNYIVSGIIKANNRCAQDHYFSATQSLMMYAGSTETKDEGKSGHSCLPITLDLILLHLLRNLVCVSRIAAFNRCQGRERSEQKCPHSKSSPPFAPSSLTPHYKIGTVVSSRAPSTSQVQLSTRQYKALF